MAVESPFKSAMLSDALFDFAQGMNNGVAPELLPKNQLSNAINATVRGDFVSPRPPFVQVPLNFDVGIQSALENGLWQGCAYYKDDYGNPFLAAAVSGRLFLLTPQGAGFFVTEITIPGDQNPAIVPKAFLWQTEKWLIWNDGQSVPVIFDGSSSRRAVQGSPLLATTASSAFAIPAVGSAVVLTLTAPYTGPFNILVGIYNAAGNFLGNFQTFSAGTSAITYNVLLTNQSAVNTSMATGDSVIVPATSGGTNVIGTSAGQFNIAGNGNTTNVPLGAPMPTGINPTGGVRITSSAGNQPINGQWFANVQPGLTNLLVQSAAGTPTWTTPTFTTWYTFSGVNSPPQGAHPIGKLTNSYAFTPGQQQLVTLDTPYSGQDGATVTVDGNPYTIVKQPAGAPVNTLSVINTNASPDTGSNKSITIGSTVLGVPELPPGRMGVYGLGRNWISMPDGKSFMASDIVGSASGTPAFNRRDAVLRFQDNTFLAGGGRFPIPSDAGEITAMLFITNLDASLGQGPLMVHTADVVFSCQAPVDNLQWQGLKNPILTEALKPYGALSDRGTINSNSDSLFRTVIGIQSLILGRRDFDVWGNVSQSFEVSPVLDDDDKTLLSFCTAIEFDNRLLMSATPINGPNGVYHTSLVALNYDPISSLRGKQQAVYDGIWTGLNALQLVKGRFADKTRAFAFNFNPNLGRNELWEILDSNQTAIFQDSPLAPSIIPNPIVMDLEFPILSFGENEPYSRSFKRLEDGEFYLQDILGQVTVQAFFSPDYDPVWHSWITVVVPASPPASGWQSRLGLGQPPRQCNDSIGLLTRDGYYYNIRMIITGECRFMGARFRSTTQPQPIFAKPLCPPRPPLLGGGHAMANIPLALHAPILDESGALILDETGAPIFSG